jgi:hypothetical protein
MFNGLAKVSGFDAHKISNYSHFFRREALPVAFCLLPNRRAATYSELFRRLKDEAARLSTQFQPKRVVSDFESALVSAVRQEVHSHRYLQQKHYGVSISD